MIVLLGLDPTVLLGLALIFALLVGAALVLDSERGRALLRRSPWFRRFESLPPTELRHHGLITLGFGVCCFAALVTLKLFGPVSSRSALILATLAVASITLGAALMERASALETGG
jgi:hypothetical protein